MLFHFSYISRANKKMSAEDLVELEFQAIENNVENQITGFLVYDGFHFFQYVEGPQEQVNFLINKIEKDGRHSSFTELSSGDVDERLLPAWSMKNFLPSDFVAEDRVHIMNIIEQKYQDGSVVEVLKGLQVRQAAAI